MTEEWPWLQTWPVFTTRGERGSRVVRVPQGVMLKPIGIGYLAIIAGFIVSFGLALAGSCLVFGVVVIDEDAEGWWWLALAAPAAVGAVLSFSGLFVEGAQRIMKSSALGMIYLVGFLGGLAVGCAALALWNSRMTPWRGGFGSVTDFFVAATTVCAFACLVTAVIAVSAIRRARREIERVLRLRCSARRYAGVVARLPDADEWDDGGDVPVRYRNPAGEHTLRVRVNTYAHEIPVRGTHVIVFVGADDDVLVEIDPRHPLEYHHDSSRYESDSSGGGS